jgi:hypothetical protein
MQTVLEDRQSIADLMTGWIHRDLAQWDKLRELFHPDGTIEITWFEGLATFRRKKPFSDDPATKLGARTRRQVAADEL